MIAAQPKTKCNETCFTEHPAPTIDPVYGMTVEQTHATPHLVFDGLPNRSGLISNRRLWEAPKNRRTP